MSEYLLLITLEIQPYVTKTLRPTSLYRTPCPKPDFVEFWRLRCKLKKMERDRKFAFVVHMLDADGKFIAEN